jgi:hypothetical protein
LFVGGLTKRHYYASSLDIPLLIYIYHKEYFYINNSPLGDKILRYGGHHRLLENFDQDLKKKTIWLDKCNKQKDKQIDEDQFVAGIKNVPLYIKRQQDYL